MPDTPYLGPNPEPGTVAARTSSTQGVPQQGDAEAALLLLAKKRFQAVAQREARMRAEMQEDQRFRASEQWPLAVKAERELDGRPCLTINRLPVFIRQVTNQQRQSKPAITINPVDSGSDPKTAEVMQGIIRHIEVNSQADIAYDTACDHQVTIGRGFFRVITEWNDLNPWEQDVKIKRIRNPFTVYFDPACLEADYHDARYAFIVEDIPKDEFVARYGEDVARSAEIFASVGDRSPEWLPEGKVRIAEYYYIEETKKEVALLSDGSVKDVKTVDSPAFKQLMEESNVREIRRRTITERQVKWAKITGSVVLEKRDWPGRWIPIIPVMGDEIDLNGDVDLRGMVRDARDPQRMYNYWVSAETETIALAPRTPFVGAEGQFEGFEAKWKLANRRNFPYLEYKPASVNETVLPPPQRNSIEPPIAAIVAATKQSDNDLKAVTGIYDASLGEKGPQEAARAIVARQKQSDIANINWIDNLARAMRALGRVLLDLIPRVYDVPRVMRILGLDDKPKMVLVHSGNEDAISDELKEGVQGIYDLSLGRYDVTVSVGPSYQSRRDEAVNAMTALMQAFPPAASAIGDLYVENMDWPGAPAIAKRLRKMVPPQMLEDDGADPEQQLIAAQQKLQQQGQVMEMMTQQLTQAKEVMRAKQQELSAQADMKAKDNESRERIEAMKMHTQILIAQITATKDATLQEDGQNHEALLAALEGEQQATLGERELDQQMRMNDLDQQHQRELAAIKLQHDSAMKLRDSAMKGRLEVQKASLKGQQEREKQLRQIEAERESKQMDQHHESTLQRREHGHTVALKASDAGHDAGRAAMDQDHESREAHAQRTHESTLSDAERKHEKEQQSKDRFHEHSMTTRTQRHERAETDRDRQYQAQQTKAQQEHDLRLAKAKPKPKPKK